MPWGAGAKKAVASHERPGGAADALRSRDGRMG